MKIIMVMVSTVNGKITRGGDPKVYHWSSLEDQEYFALLKSTHRLLVYGSATYQVAKDKIDLSQDNLRVVLTRQPDRYKSEEVPGKLEFSDEEPKRLVERLSSLGFTEMLLLGGGVTNSLFLREGLVDEIHLTLEPRLFGEGKGLVEGENIEGLDVSLELISTEKLNDAGTLLLNYRVAR